MKASEFRERIKVLAKQVWREKQKRDDASLAYPELQEFPILKLVIVDLLTTDFDKFMESIDWIAPRPTTFRINLLNGYNFLLEYTRKSWIATVEGKKYYLENLAEEEHCCKAIARILRNGANTAGVAGGADAEGSEDIDIETDIEVDETDA